MKFTNDILIILLPIILFAGCATIKGNTVAEQRQYVLDMRDETLARLYDDKPIAKEQIKKAAGYGVFSNIGSHIFLLSTGSGYGVITDNKDKKLTYMNMMTVGGGFWTWFEGFPSRDYFQKA